MHLQAPPHLTGLRERGTWEDSAQGNVGGTAHEHRELEDTFHHKSHVYVVPVWAQDVPAVE